MSRSSKTETSVLDNLQLPSDLADLPTTEMPDSVAEPLLEAPAMPQLSVLDRLKAEAESEKLAVEVEWNRVVTLVATDAANDDDVASILFASGKSISELEVAVTRQKKVTRLQSLIADIPAALAAEAEARRAFKSLQKEQDAAIKAMKVEHRRVHGLMTTATWRRSKAENARFDLDSMSREWGAFIPPPPQWTDQYNPEPCIAEQLKVEERVNEQIAARLGPNAVTGPYCSAGTEPAKGFRVFANQ